MTYVSRKNHPKRVQNHENKHGFSPEHRQEQAFQRPGLRHVANQQRIDISTDGLLVRIVGYGELAAIFGVLGSVRSRSRAIWGPKKAKTCTERIQKPRRHENLEGFRVETDLLGLFRVQEVLCIMTHGSSRKLLDATRARIPRELCIYHLFKPSEQLF